MPERTAVVSSAYRRGFVSSPSIVIPFILGFSQQQLLMFSLLEEIGLGIGRGSPCRTPRVRLK